MSAPVYTAADFATLNANALDLQVAGFRESVAYMTAIVGLNQTELDNARLGLCLVTAEAERRQALKNAEAA